MKRSVLAVAVLATTFVAHAGMFGTSYNGTSTTAGNIAFGHAYVDAKNNQAQPANSTTVSRADHTSRTPGTPVGQLVGSSTTAYTHSSTVANDAPGANPSAMAAAVAAAVAHNANTAAENQAALTASKMASASPPAGKAPDVMNQGIKNDPTGKPVSQVAGVKNNPVGQPVNRVASVKQNPTGNTINQAASAIKPNTPVNVTDATGKTTTTTAGAIAKTDPTAQISVNFQSAFNVNQPKGGNNNGRSEGHNEHGTGRGSDNAHSHAFGGHGYGHDNSRSEGFGGHSHFH